MKNYLLRQIINTLSISNTSPRGYIVTAKTCFNLCVMFGLGLNQAEKNYKMVFDCLAQPVRPEFAPSKHEVGA